MHRKDAQTPGSGKEGTQLINEKIFRIVLDEDGSKWVQKYFIVNSFRIEMYTSHLFKDPLVLLIL